MRADRDGERARKFSRRSLRAGIVCAVSFAVIILCVILERVDGVAEWGARIDAYLAGSPLAGQGTTFAEAAWEYGCDPRFSPAIAMVESSLGRNCFLPHNAWGWGSSSWDSWEEAIWDHVRGLATIYGGQLTYAGAQMYCPPNADHWYASVLANMERI